MTTWYQAMPRKTHGQHFLLSAKARSLSLRDVMQMTDDEAMTMFRSIRWASTEGEPVCPDCGLLRVRLAPHLQMQGLRQAILDHVGADLRQPQADDPGLPPGHRHLHQRGQGHFLAPAGPGSRRPAQDGLRPDTQAARGPHATVRAHHSSRASPLGEQPGEQTAPALSWRPIARHHPNSLSRHCQLAMATPPRLDPAQDQRRHQSGNQPQRGVTDHRADSPEYEWPHDGQIDNCLTKI